MKCDWVGFVCTVQPIQAVFNGSYYSPTLILNAIRYLKKRQRVLTNIVWWQHISCDISVEMYSYQKNKVDKKGGLRHNGGL